MLSRHLCCTSPTLLIENKRRRGCGGSVTCPKLHMCPCKCRTPIGDLLASLHPSISEVLTVCQAQCSTVLPEISSWIFMTNPGIRHFIILTLPTRIRRVSVFRGLIAAKFQKQKLSINSLTVTQTWITSRVSSKHADSEHPEWCSFPSLNGITKDQAVNLFWVLSRQWAEMLWF